MRYFLLYLAALVAAGCAQDSGLPTPSGEGTIRAINAIPASPSVAFRIEERALDNLAYKDIGASVRYDDFEYNFNFDAALLPREAGTRIATLPLKIDKARDYTLILTGTLDAAEVEVWDHDLREWSDTDTVFEVRFGHLAGSLGTLDAYLVEEGGTPDAGNQLGTLAYGAVLPAMDRPEGKYKLVLTTSGDPGDVVYLAPEITYTQQQSYLLSIFDGDEVDTAPYSVRYTVAGSVGGPLPDTRYGPTLRLYHAATSMPAADIYDDEMLTSQLYANLAFGDVSPDLPVNAGTNELTYTAAGNPGVTLLEATATSGTGSHRNLVVIDDPDDGSPAAFDYTPDRRSTSTYAKLSVFHAAANQEAVNIYITPAGDEIGALTLHFGILYGGASSQVGEVAGSYDLYATPIDSLVPIAGPTRLDLAAGDVVEVMLLDTEDPNSAAFSIVPPP